MNSNTLQHLFIDACRLDVQALKPGNVGVHAPGADMCAADFERSAEACAAPLCAPGLALGERILRAVEARRAAVAVNTNLGIVLLCAPPIQAALAGAPPRAGVPRVLAATTVADARAAYRAIRLAEPGGMGRVAQADLAGEPDIDLRAAMELARDRDDIAAQYADDYRFLFERALPLLLAFRARWGYTAWSITGLFLSLLAERPDTLIARKRGLSVAQTLCAEIAPTAEEFARLDDPDAFAGRLLALDARLKKRALNPGTTADLTVASVLIAAIEEWFARRAVS